MMNLTRNQRRQLDKLSPHIDRVLAGDIAFFKQHPDRQHRVRLMSEVEIAQVETVNSTQLRTPNGHAWFSVIRKVPCARLRVFVTNPAEVETGLAVPEDLAREIFDAVAPPQIRELEAALRARGARV